MVTKDIPTLIAEESIRRTARRIRQDVESGKTEIHLYASDKIADAFGRENMLFFAALTWITKMAKCN